MEAKEEQIPQTSSDPVQQNQQVVEEDVQVADEEKKPQAQVEEQKDDNTILRVGKKLNEDGEWEEYVEEDQADRPPIAYDYMGSEALPIDPEDEVVDFCMQYRIPKIEGLEECKNLKVSIFMTCFTNRYVFQKLGLRKNLVTKIEGIENCN